MNVEEFVQDSISRSLSKYLELHPNGELTAGEGVKIENGTISFNYATAGKKAVAYIENFHKNTSYAPMMGAYDSTEYIDISAMNFSAISDYSVEIGGKWTDYITENESSRSYSYNGNFNSNTISVYITKEVNRIVVRTTGTKTSSGGSERCAINYQLFIKVYHIGTVLPTYVGSGWGVAKNGTETITFNQSTTSSVVVSIADLGLADANYYVAVSGNFAGVWVSGKTSSNFRINGSLTSQSSISRSVEYTVFAKGYGGVPNGGTTGQVLAKKSGADGDTEWRDVLILESPNGTKYKLIVLNDGTLSTEAV